MWEAIWKFLIGNPGVTIIGAFTLVQIAPIKINPWTWLAGLIHKFLFGKIDEKLDSIGQKVDRLEAQAEEEKALQARTHILRFSDECYNGQHHSKEYFDNVLEDIDRYEKYCEAHPKFKNNKTILSTQMIRETYARLLEEHAFL